MLARSRLVLSSVAALSLACPARGEPSAKELHLGVKKWQILERESGPVDYCAVVADPEMPYIRAHYKPPTRTAVLGYMLTDGDRAGARALRWKWRVHKGAICGKKRSAFVAREKVILESGGTLDVWQSEELDLKAEFRKHFEDGNPNADVPDFMGVGIMTDGDQTNTEVVADYADFVLLR